MRFLSYKYVIILLLILFVVSSSIFLDITLWADRITRFISWVHSLGYIAPVVIFIVHSLAITVCFPVTILFEWGCGFLFGVIGGSLLIMISKTTGAAICFMIGMNLSCVTLC